MPATIEEAVQDKDFQAAPPSQQLRYLEAVDPDFKNAKAEDQLAYLNHITGKPAPTTVDNPAENKEQSEQLGGTLWEKAKALPAAILPDENTHPLDALGRMSSGAWSGIKAMNPFQGASDPDVRSRIASEALDPVNALGPVGKLAESGVQGYREARGEGAGVIPSVGSGLAHMVGLDAPGIRERASQGDVAGVIGEGIPAVGAAILGGEAENIGKRLPSVKPLVTAPVRYAARAAEDMANSSLSPVRAIKGMMQPADEAAALRIKMPGRDLGLPSISEPQPNVGMPVSELPYERLTQPQGPQVPIGGLPAVESPTPPTIRRTPGQIAPESVGAPQERVPLTPMRPPTVDLSGGGTMRGPQPLLPAAPEPAQAPAGLPSVEGAAKPPAPARMPAVAPIDRLEGLIRQAAGTPELEPATSLRNQPKTMTPARPSAGQQVSDVINKNTETEAVRPLSAGPQKATPLKEITAPPAEPVTHRATITHEGKTYGIEAANGKLAYEATKHDTALAKSLYDLKGPEVRQAFMNLGGDVNTVGLEGQRYKVGNSGTNERTQMFDFMFKKGHTPQEIIQAAKVHQ